MKLCVDDFSWIFDVQLVSPEDAEYWTYFDAKGFTGSSLALVSTSGVPEEEWKAWIMLSDDVPGEEDIYKEKDRPYYHFSNSRGWINDPNGLMYNAATGEYHMFYQHNPYGAMWGNMHWGAASSRDLISWEHHGDVLRPDGLGTIFSGSAVVDHDNTAGFGKGAVIAFYTSADRYQQQSMAYSTDGSSDAKRPKASRAGSIRAATITPPSRGTTPPKTGAC